MYPVSSHFSHLINTSPHWCVRQGQVSQEWQQGRQGSALMDWPAAPEQEEHSRAGGDHQGRPEVLPSLDEVMVMRQVRPSKAQGLEKHIYNAGQPRQGARSRAWAERVGGGKPQVQLFMALLPAVWFSCTISELTLNTGKQSRGKGKLAEQDCR